MVAATGDASGQTTPYAYVDAEGVCGGNVPCFDGIQSAISASAETTRIRIAEGTYAEIVTVNKNVTLEIGWDRDFQSQDPSGPVLLKKPSVCGDGLCESDETYAACPQDCDPVCGDGLCEGDETAASCPPDCDLVCGNGIVNPLYEECDDGRETASCDTDCTYSLCGDRRLNIAAGEQCDDGNTVSGDGCDPWCMHEAPAQATPLNLFNVGDSIGAGEAAYGETAWDDLYEPHHDVVWSTGFNAGDGAYSLNERFEAADPLYYYENNDQRDATFNHAVSGSLMSDFESQVESIITAASQTPSGRADMITILLGSNDMCAPSLEEMTDPADFETDFRLGLDALADSDITKHAAIHVSGIPAIYWLWEAKRLSLSCRLFVWPFVPCQNLLDDPADDCASEESRLDPDTIYYAGGEIDGENCIRRKLFHAEIRDTYNVIIRDVLQEYIEDGRLPNAYYVDIFDIRFEDSHVNGGDCFHPSVAGHALLGEEQWCRSPWGVADPSCGQ